MTHMVSRGKLAHRKLMMEYNVQVSSKRVVGQVMCFGIIILNDTDTPGKWHHWNEQKFSVDTLAVFVNRL